MFKVKIVNARLPFSTIEFESSINEVIRNMNKQFDVKNVDVKLYMGKFLAVLNFEYDTKR
jgi:hypothetical protein